jgi:hypothetical protein
MPYDFCFRRQAGAHRLKDLEMARQGASVPTVSGDASPDQATLPPAAVGLLAVNPEIDVTPIASMTALRIGRRFGNSLRATMRKQSGVCLRKPSRQVSPSLPI